MFGSIIGHDKIIRLLKNDVIKKSLNNSMIFHGSRSTGKLSTAFELGRILNCKYNGDSECQCSNCTRYKTVDFEGLIFLSRRNFYYNLYEYANAYKISKEPKFVNFITRIIKLTFLPLQDFLIKDCLSEPEKKMIAEQSEKTMKIIYKNELSNPDIDDLLEIVSEISGIYKKTNIPVDSLRGMLDWTYISQPDINKIVIIDHVDMLEESSRNILLKRLEEPSPNLFFILLAENKNRIIETIRSRCRCYFFNRLSTDSVMDILNQNFCEKNIYTSVDSFIMRSDAKSKENIYPIVIKLLNFVFQKEHKFPELNSFIQGFKDRKYVKAILLEIGSMLEREIKIREMENAMSDFSGPEPDFKYFRQISYFDMQNLLSLVKDKSNKIDRFGLNPTLVLEGVFYPLKAMVQNDQI
jgi:DNA polymerase III delta prime subunit